MTGNLTWGYRGKVSRVSECKGGYHDSFLVCLSDPETPTNLTEIAHVAAAITGSAVFAHQMGERLAGKRRPGSYIMTGRAGTGKTTAITCIETKVRHAVGCNLSKNLPYKAVAHSGRPSALGRRNEQCGDPLEDENPGQHGTSCFSA